MAKLIDLFCLKRWNFPEGMCQIIKLLSKRWKIIIMGATTVMRNFKIKFWQKNLISIQNYYLWLFINDYCRGRIIAIIGRWYLTDISEVAKIKFVALMNSIRSTWWCGKEISRMRGFKSKWFHNGPPKGLAAWSDIHSTYVPKDYSNCPTMLVYNTYQ